MNERDICKQIRERIKGNIGDPKWNQFNKQLNQISLDNKKAILLELDPDMKRCLKEALSLFPGATFTVQRVNED